MKTLLSILLSAAFVLTASPALASIASPTSGFPFGLRIGQTAYVKLKNANGCTFNQVSVSNNPVVATVAPAAGQNLTRTKIGITGVSVGMTNVTITTSGGTCPQAVHDYPVTVTADFAQIQKDFQKEVKFALKDYRIGAKAIIKDYKFSLRDFGVDYKDGTIDEVGLFQNVHGAATQFRQSYYLNARDAYAHAIAFGSNQLASAQATYGEGPDELFMGGWKGFDELQNYVCTDAAKFQTITKKETDKAAKKYMKNGAPKITVLNAVQPIVAGGSLYPDQQLLMSVAPPPVAPLTITVLPAYNMTGDNGRVAISGIGSDAESGNLDVTLTFDSLTMPGAWTVSPPISGEEWDAEFSGLTEGNYRVTVGYQGDASQVEFSVGVGWQF